MSDRHFLLNDIVTTDEEFRRQEDLKRERIEQLATIAQQTGSPGRLSAHLQAVWLTTFDDSAQ